MFSKHLRDQDISAFVLHQSNNEYMNITDKQFLSFKNHIDNCDICRSKAENAQEIFQSMNNNNAKKLRYYLLTAALIICFFAIKYFEADDTKIFEINPDFEIFIDGQLRSDDIVVSKPTRNEIVSLPYNFEWSPKKNITLLIYNNRSVLIVDTLLNDSTFHLKKPLAEGLYYWKIESPDELLYISKFKIEAK